MVAAFRSGILVLLVAPFALFAAVAVLAVRDQQRRSATTDRGTLEEVVKSSSATR